MKDLKHFCKQKSAKTQKILSLKIRNYEKKKTKRTFREKKLRPSTMKVAVMPTILIGRN